MHAAVDAEAGDEGTLVFLNMMSKAWSILESVAESQGRTTEDLTSEEVQQAVVEAYFLCTTAPKGHGGGGRGGSSAGAASWGISSSSTFSQKSNRAPGGSKSQGRGRGRGRGRGTKRGRSEGSGDEEENKEGDGKRRKRRPSPDHGLPWLCPFYLRDPVRYRGCLGYKLSRINDVRTHIERHHMRPPHCPICGCLFPDDPAGTARDAHIRGCQTRVDVDCPGATAEQWLEIGRSGANRANGRKRNTFHSDEDEWFNIWGILFPERARPLDPHARHPDGVQFTRDAHRMYLEQGYPAAIAHHTLGETAHPDTHALLRQMISYYNGVFIRFMEELEILAATGRSAPQNPILMPLPPLPTLAASSPDQYAGSNTGNPHVMAPQSLPLREPPAGPTVADAGPHTGPTPLQANPHASVGVNAGPEDVDVFNEPYLYPPGVPRNPRHAME